MRGQGAILRLGEVVGLERRGGRLGRTPPERAWNVLRKAWARTVTRHSLVRYRDSPKRRSRRRVRAVPRGIRALDAGGWEGLLRGNRAMQEVR